MVDGAARPGSVLTLSHWPQSPTPRPLARDLSAEIVLDLQRALRRLDPAPPPARAGSAPEDVLEAAAVAVNRAEAATSDHFDEDGLAALFGLVNPEAALGAAELLVGVASCGDFGVVRSDVSARICFAIGPLATAEAAAKGEISGGVPGAMGAGVGRPGTSELYSAILPRLPELLTYPERFERCWAEDWAALLAGRAALEKGAVTIEEYADVDLAVVRRLDRPAGGKTPAHADRPANDHRGGGGDPNASRLDGVTGALPVHPAAVHSATSASRILAFDGEQCELYFRYVSWVRVVSRRVPLRPDLGPLALELSAADPSASPWEENGVGALVARVRPVTGRTEIDPALIVTTVRRYLAATPPAWDPFREGSGYIPAGERAGYLPHAPGSPDAASGRRRSRVRRRT